MAAEVAFRRLMRIEWSRSARTAMGVTSTKSARVEARGRGAQEASTWGPDASTLTSDPSDAVCGEAPGRPSSRPCAARRLRMIYHY